MPSFAHFIPSPLFLIRMSRTWIKWLLLRCPLPLLLMRGSRVLKMEILSFEDTEHCSEWCQRTQMRGGGEHDPGKHVRLRYVFLFVTWQSVDITNRTHFHPDPMSMSCHSFSTLLQSSATFFPLGFKLSLILSAINLVNHRRHDLASLTFFHLIAAEEKEEKEKKVLISSNDPLDFCR